MNSRFDYTILNAIENAVRTVKAAPLLLGSTSTGSGGPVGGFVGYLPQNKVSYDQDELAYSGLPYSGISLTDNLAHIRYRLDAVESGGGGGGASSFLDLNDTPTTYSGQVGKALVVNLAEDGLEFDSIGGTPAGNDTNVQYNDGGAFGGEDSLSFDKTYKSLDLGNGAASVIADGLKYRLNLIGDETDSPALDVWSFNIARSPSLTFWTQDGTFASSTNVKSGQMLGRTNARAGRQSSPAASGAGIDWSGSVSDIRLVANQDFNPTSNGTRVEVWTTPDNSTTLAKAATFGQDKSLAVVGAVTGSNLSGTNTGDQSLAGLQPLDSDLTAIAALSPANDDIIQRKAGAWTNRTVAQYITDLTSGLSALFAPITAKVDAADEATLRQRMDGLTYSQHFDVSSMPAGFTWAGSPFITPSTVNFTLPSQMFISNTGSWRAFLYGALPTSNAYLQTVINYLAGTSNYGFVGLRYDDGSDNNYIELGLYNYGWGYHVAKIYKRTGGGAVTETTDAVNFYMPQMFVVSTSQYGTKWSSWGCNLNLGLTGQGATALIAYRIGVSGLSFTPTRFGIVFRGNTEFSSLTDAYSKD